MKVQELTKEDLKDLIYRLRNKPTFITAFEKLMLGKYLEEQFQEVLHAVPSSDCPEK